MSVWIRASLLRNLRRNSTEILEWLHILSKAWRLHSCFHKCMILLKTGNLTLNTLVASLERGTLSKVKNICHKSPLKQLAYLLSKLVPITNACWLSSTILYLMKWSSNFASIFSRTSHSRPIILYGSNSQVPCSLPFLFLKYLGDQCIAPVPRDYSRSRWLIKQYSYYVHLPRILSCLM